MSDEELAEFMDKVYCPLDFTQGVCEEEHCCDCWLKWFKRVVDEEKWNEYYAKKGELEWNR